MSFFIGGEHSNFPSVELADEDGLLAIGGKLTFERLIDAYPKGIFPWNNVDEPVCWYCPDPRFILFPENLKVSHSMRSIINKKKLNNNPKLEFLYINNNIIVNDIEIKV